ncbi:MAG: Lipopolysaccharide assembly protein domain [Solirubrobacterales bacterium]|jgi:uncharacterized integral membrane protein|nr:Lipopolysaccharide assembly protein domain [Solirubrobacterales bacterium]
MADEISTPPPPKRTSLRTWGLVAALILAIVFVVANSQRVEIDFILGKATTSLVFALLIAMLLGFAIGWLSARWRAHRR